MKKLRVILAGVALVFNFGLHAQQSFSPTSTSEDDLSVMVQAIEQTTPVSPDSLPRNGSVGTFYSAQFSQWPPMPGDVNQLPVWSLGDGVYLLNDQNFDYAEAAAESAAASPKMKMSMTMSSLSTAYAYGNPVYLTNMAASVAYDGRMTANFSIGGGTNFVPYDILMSTNLLNPIATLTWLGIGYTSNYYTFTNQPTDLAFYNLAKPSKTMVVPWGDDIYGQCDVPFGITNAVQVTGGIEFSLALLTNGTVMGWGYNGATESELVPTNLTGVAMIASGWEHNVALLTNGTVTAWGDDYFGETDVPAGLTNVTVISAQALHSLALTSNGVVVAWGYGPEGETSIPSGLTNVTAIAAGGEHNLAVSNGFVVAWGYDDSGQCDVPAGLSNVWDVAAGWEHSVALKKDGTVVCWGANAYGESTVPVGLSNVVAIAAGGDPDTDSAYSLALKSDGTVVAWGKGETVSSAGLNDIIAIGAGADHALAIRTGPRTPVITLAPVNQYQVAGGNVTFNVKGVGLYGVTYQWQTNGVNLAGATNTTLAVTNVQSTTASNYTVVVTDNGGMGSIVSSNASFVLVTPPVILSQAPMPTNQVATYQTNLTLSVNATAPGQSDGFPLYYQWQFNGTNISGATSNSYSFLVDTPLLGAYSVIVSNMVGSITSLVWQVTMTYAGSYIAPGTLAYYLSTNTAAYTNGHSPSDTLRLSGWTYATYSATNMALLTNAVWSTNFWLKGVRGLSATPIGISNNLEAQTLITMVSPRHYLRASHTGTPTTLIAFLDTNNVIYWRRVVQQVFIPESYTFGISNDISVGILDADLPPSVGFLPVMPTNFASYLPTNNTSYVQGIGMNQDSKLFSQPMTFGDPLFVDWNSGTAALFGLSTSWNIALRGGDSSDPEMLLISNQLVLVSDNFHAGNGPNHGVAFNAINQYMHYLSTNNVVGTDYQLTPFSLTNWPTIH